MLIRFVVNNIFSFEGETEFTMIPNNRLKTLKRHSYKINDFNVLKLSSIYGANGAGKSNLLKSLELFKELIVEEESVSTAYEEKFKLNDEQGKDSQTLAIEFIQNNIPLYYGVVIDKNIVSTEELYISGLGKREDELVYERKTNKEGVTNIKFSDEFEKDEKNLMLKTLLIDEFIEPNKLILKLLSKKKNELLKNTKNAYKWFTNTLYIISPNSKYAGFAHQIDANGPLKEYTEELLRSFDLGIKSISSEKKSFQEFFGEEKTKDHEQLLKDVDESPRKMINLVDQNGSEIILIKEGDDVFVKELKLWHRGKKDKSILFSLDEESDGTRRLLDLTPAFLLVTSNPVVFFIDEIERSIHPLLIKEIISKFSLGEGTKGQLIFTTHESNLLDQNIFRQDEIWFTEKNHNGSTEIYPLSDFKQHKTLDIRKGYLDGRYGSIPFLGNLKDLNWRQHDIKE